MGAGDEGATALRKTELVDRVAEEAASRSWAPASLSWRAEPQGGPDGDRDTEDADDAATPEPESALHEDGEGAGAFIVTPEGQAALAATA